ncbi:MAG: DUF3552 domain-containing protein [Deltaproteobacteria bacterium]|nr:DUF3552 domain-containing protein [Deltaproteobacteria bacterium]
MITFHALPLILIVGFICLLGLFLGWRWRRSFVEQKNNAARECAQEIIREARRTAFKIEETGKKNIEEYEAKASAKIEQLHFDRLAELNRTQDALDQKDKEICLQGEYLCKKEKEVVRRETAVQEQQSRAAVLENRCKDLQSRLVRKLEQASQISSSEARAELMRSFEEAIKKEKLRLSQNLEEEAKRTAEGKARRLLTSAIERYAHAVLPERSISIVKLPNEEMKGRIIGREGRNIRALEAAAGVSIVIDETPEILLITGFDPLRREIAARALEKLIDDGKIHPARIEEEVIHAQAEVEKLFVELGEQAAFEGAIHDLPKELVRLVGMLKFRQGEGQNLYEHSLEVARLSRLIAAELGLDVQKAFRAGLLHDIGRALDGVSDRQHAAAGAKAVRQYGESEEIADSIALHETDERTDVLLVSVVRGANRLSEQRAGARKHASGEAVERLKELENYAAIDGVERAFVIKTGRILKVFVETAVEDVSGREGIERDIEDALTQRLSGENQIEVIFTKMTKQSVGTGETAQLPQEK